MRSKKPTPLKKFLRRWKTTRVSRALGVAVLGAIVIFVTAVAILVAAHQPSQPGTTRTSRAQPQPQPHDLMDPVTTKALPPFETKNIASKVAAQDPPSMSITGCLERDADSYRLENTSGADAPKSRSWKSAFLKKHAISIDVVDATNRLHLASQLGQRVSVVGALVGREMQARSLRRVSGSCDD
jgi:hypothetical protein